ncbi:ATP-binding cassette domain-containing protein [Sphingomonas sp. ACRSK]|uniref:ATP-binding cassette domain-containing protein n=1 Tax=Sphingomonas sp. ACRSK TaxID=2918213 RepID=UPI001EF44328|nr:ATP-binding cassette domain-containing protein [Sphingomonas sp. ACRSK]MCG7349015.1 ATP-binding cassette domain-containing protein [Sphingomonas sp. ACRSK]
MKIELNKSFSSRTERSERVIKVAEAFGLGLEDREFTVLDQVEVDVNPGDVVYICGQSGAGKSVLLRELAAKLAQAGQAVANIDQVELQPDKALIDQVGEDGLADAIRLLSVAGLSDAYLYIRKPGELSDGQRYRFRLAKLVEGGCDVWVADEFGAVLDRVTAKIVAWNLAKVARAHGKTLIVATTHTDLQEELAPSLTITKRFHDRIKVEHASA